MKLPTEQQNPLSEDKLKELDQKLEELQILTGDFYHRARQAGAGAFAEFTGLMNEYLKVCKQSQTLGVDWSQSTPSNDVPLVALPHNIRYLQEKIQAIFEPFAVVNVRPRRDDEPRR